MAAVDLVEDCRSVVLRHGAESPTAGGAPEKFSTAGAHFEAQKALTVQNVGGYDALTAPN
jgi:hypothetical protein